MTELNKLDPRTINAIKGLLSINFSYTLISEMFLIDRKTISLIVANN